MDLGFPIPVIGKVEYLSITTYTSLDNTHTAQWEANISTFNASIGMH